MSFPPGTEMFQFPGFASLAYVFSKGSSRSWGLPHSDTAGSKFARNSPALFAACHVLHRLSMPRHPPNALITLVSLSTPVMRSQQRKASRPNAKDCNPTKALRTNSYPVDVRFSAQDPNP